MGFYLDTFLFLSLLKISFVKLFLKSGVRGSFSNFTELTPLLLLYNVTKYGSLLSEIFQLFISPSLSELLFPPPTLHPLIPLFQSC